MISPLLFAIIIILLGIYFYYNVIRIPKDFPPGPLQLPIWGGYYQVLWENFWMPHRAIHEMSKRYKSSVVGTFFGNKPTVIACDWETVREVLLRPEFQARPSTFFPVYRGDGEAIGIFFTEGDFWKEQRRFMLRNMRDFGFGKRSDVLEEKLEEEIKDLIELLRNGNKPFCKDGYAKLPHSFYATYANMGLQVFSGDRKSLEEAYEIGDVLVEQNKKIETTTGALNFTPWIRHIFPKQVGFDVTKYATKFAKDLVQKLINEHSTSITDDTTNDFVDRYINELRKQEDYESDSTFSEKQLRVIGMDLLFASSTAVPIMTSFIIYILCKYPDVQKKCQQEIEEVVGKNRLPSVSDRVNLPYTEAVIREVFRFQTLVPLGVPHRAMKDTTLGGYFVPKNSMVLTSLYSAHLDEKVFDKPTEFRPERFLTPDGNLNKRDLTVPFGLGKRVCAGETFARQNIFATMASILQNFTFIECPTKPFPSLKDNFSGINESPQPFWVKIEPRQ